MDERKRKRKGGGKRKRNGKEKKRKGKAQWVLPCRKCRIQVYKYSYMTET